MSQPQPTLIEYFSHDHRSADSRWAEVEAAVEQGEAENIENAWSRFDLRMRTHLRKEEEILFPAFEAATGMTEGPTQVMRSEHQQMRGLLDQMAGALERGERDELVDLGDTLLMLIQQHNQKEEQVLYPMAERALGTQWPALREKLDTLAAAG